MVGGDIVFFREARKILKENPDGMLKEHFIKIMTDSGISSRVTIYKKFPEMIYTKGQKIMRVERHGKRKLYFPTESTIKIENFYDKLQTARNFLNMLENEKDIGDHITIFQSNDKKKQFHFENTRKTLERGYRKPRNFILKTSIPTYSKYFLLKEFPFMVFEQINKTFPSLPKSITKELFAEILEITNSVFKIIHESYSDYKNYAVSAGLNAFMKKWTNENKQDNGIITMKMFRPEDIMNKRKWYVEKLTDILFMLHLKYGKDEFWRSSQEIIVLDFLKRFFSNKDIPENFDVVQKTMLKKW